MTARGTSAEGILLKMLLEHGIEAEHGSPSRPGDIIIPPNVIVEIKDPKERSYSFLSHSAKGAKQWKALKEKKEKFHWLEIYYVVRFARKEWRYFHFPENVRPLLLQEGNRLENLFSDLLVSQNRFAISQGGEK